MVEREAAADGQGDQRQQQREAHARATGGQREDQEHAGREQKSRLGPGRPGRPREQRVIEDALDQLGVDLDAIQRQPPAIVRRSDRPSAVTPTSTSL